MIFKKKITKRYFLGFFESLNKYGGGIGNFILAILGIYLTIKFNQESSLDVKRQIEIEKQEKRIMGFDTLLKTTFAQIDTLGKVISILNNQLSVSRLGDINKLESAVFELKQADKEPSNNPKEIENERNTGYFKKALIILKSQQDNSFLLENDTLSARWIACYLAVQDYLNSTEEFVVQVPSRDSSLLLESGRKKYYDFIYKKIWFMLKYTSNYIYKTRPGIINKYNLRDQFDDEVDKESDKAERENRIKYGRNNSRPRRTRSAVPCP